MAVLSDPDRVTVWAQIQRDNTNLINVNKTELRAAINAADDWANTNAASFNSALPAAAQGGLTGRQKALLLLYVVRQRWVVS